jgi:hypothetical protein
VLAASTPTLDFVDDSDSSCSITKTGDKLALTSGCCVEDDCSKSIDTRLTVLEAAVAAVNITTEDRLTAVETTVAGILTNYSNTPSSPPPSTSLVNPNPPFTGPVTWTNGINVNSGLVVPNSVVFGPSVLRKRSISRSGMQAQFPPRRSTSAPNSRASYSLALSLLCQKGYQT